jgi:hypothetical protein
LAPASALSFRFSGSPLHVPDQALEAADGAKVRFSLLSAHLRAMVPFGTRALRVGPYAALGVERLAGEVAGISESRPGATFLLSSSGGVEGRALLTGHLGLSAHGGALVPLERPVFRVAGIEGRIHEPDALGAEAFLGVFWEYGSQM